MGSHTKRAAFVALVTAGLIAIAACAQETSPVGPGEECFLASDCQPGLVCVPQPNGSRQCSADLTGFEGTPPPDGAVADTAVNPDAVADAPSQDTSVMDTGTDTSVADAGGEAG